MKNYLLVVCAVVSGTMVYGIEKKVNGSATLWNKKYNEAAYAATHNGSSHLSCSVQNQDVPLVKQFESGIRATKIHVWNACGKENERVPYVCHGVTQDIFEGPYLEKVVAKVPSLFQGWARDALKQMEPVNELVRDAFKAAYGDGKTPGAVQFNHCIFDPSRTSLVVMLRDVKKFLDEHPHEVITLILEDHTHDLDRIVKDFKDNDLMSYLHIQEVNKSWPTLGHMVETNKRLVVFVHGDEVLEFSKYPGIHNLWQFAWDTEWNFDDAGALKNARNDIFPKRGKDIFAQRMENPKNKLFVVHHFVTPSTGGCKKSAKKVNHKNFLLARLNRLKKDAGHVPNIIQVDFFQYPNNDIFEVVNSLNES